jgi:ABC-2 type transport system ATP-binding protein
MIAVEQIRKSFDGTQALDGFSLRVDSGELFGLVGPNGAGKSTLIKILSTLLTPDGGRAQISGLDVTTHCRDIRRLVGYMPDQPGVYQDMSVREFLQFFADAFQLTGTRNRAAIDRALERSGLKDRRNDSVEQLSFGMKQRLILAKTLLHGPKVLLLDEPATGLDPIARIELREQLKRLRAEGITILISSHILSDLEEICTQIAMIRAGRNATDEQGHAVIQLRAASARAHIYEIAVIGDTTVAASIANSTAGVRVLESGNNVISVEITGAETEVAAVLRALVTGGVGVVRLQRRDPGLEDRYRMAFGEKHP